MKLAVVGAGWAGLACAVEATRSGHVVTLIEASRMLGGRARRVEEHDLLLDNGQHILIGAYRDTLALMRDVGVDLEAALLRLPLSLRFADGRGLAVPNLSPPFDLLAGIVTARGWSWRDKLALVRVAQRWRREGFACDSLVTVDALCRALPPRVMHELIEPLCVSALNTPTVRASGQVFLRVLHDALFGERGGADLLLPQVDLGALFPDAATLWLAARGTAIHTGRRAHRLANHGAGWWLDGESFDRVVLACAPWDAARLLRDSALVEAAAWCNATEALAHEGIATVYATGAPSPLAAPMLALRSNDTAPAQFVFDRGQLGGPPGLLAFVVSACHGARDTLQAAVLRQAAEQLGLSALTPLQTIIEKRATFSCTPGLQRPPMHIAPELLACGDYVDGPYPSTLEGAVRSGLAAARSPA